MSNRALNQSVFNSHPSFSAIRAILIRFFSSNADPPTRSNGLFAFCISAIAFLIKSVGTFLELFCNITSSILEPSFQAVSPGNISVAISPGFLLATFIASAASNPISFDDLLVFTQLETGFAIPSMSEVKGAFNFI